MSATNTPRARSGDDPHTRNTAGHKPCTPFGADRNTKAPLHLLSPAAITKGTAARRAVKHRNTFPRPTFARKTRDATTVQSLLDDVLLRHLYDARCTAALASEIESPGDTDTGIDRRRMEVIPWETVSRSVDRKAFAQLFCVADRLTIAPVLDLKQQQQQHHNAIAPTEAGSDAQTRTL